MIDTTFRDLPADEQAAQLDRLNNNLTGGFVARNAGRWCKVYHAREGDMEGVLQSLTLTRKPGGFLEFRVETDRGVAHVTDVTDIVF